MTAMNPQKYTEKAQEAIVAAQHDSERRQHSTLTSIISSTPS